MRKTMGVMYIVSMLGLVLAGCAKKEEPPAPAPATPASPAQEQTNKKVVEQAAQEAVAKVAQEANQVQTTAVATVQQVAAEQTVCPVMKGQPIDKTIFVEYQGKKVYFCCASCKVAFEKEPEKYVKDLPQFKQ